MPNSDATSGGTFSPRLEAELINMLSRPAQRGMPAPVERAQLAVFYGLVGALAGMFLLGLAFWLAQFQSQLQSRIQEQTESFQALARQIDQSAASQHLVNEAVLAKVEGEKTVSFESILERAYKAREVADQKLNNQRTISETLSARTKELETREHNLVADLEKALKDRDLYAKDRADAALLTKRVTALQESNQRQQERLEKLEPFFETAEGKQAIETQHQLTRWQYAAYAGWGCTALLSLGFVAAYLYYKPLVDDATLEGDRPTHRIE